MAPGQVPQQWLPWRDAHPFFLLSPLMGLFSRAWSRLRSPGLPESWLVEAGTRADQEEAQASLAARHGPRYPQEKTGEMLMPEENGDASGGGCPHLKASSSHLEFWGLSEAAGGREHTARGPGQGSEGRGGHAAPLPPKMRTLQDLGEEASEEGAVEDEEVSMLSLLTSSWESCPGMVEEVEDRAPIHTEASRTSASPFAPGSRLRARVYCPVEADDGVTEGDRTEDKAAVKTWISPSVGSHPTACECDTAQQCRGKRDEKAEEGEADPGPHASLPAQRPLLRSWQHRPSKISAKGDNEEDSASGTARGLTPAPLTSAFVRAWVYQPGEDTEEEEDDEENSDSGAAEEWGEAEGFSPMPPISAFMKAWVYRPGEDTEEEEEEEDDEDSDSGAAEESGEAEGLSSMPPASAFVRAWVYRPGEDTEEEEEEEEEEDSDWGTTEEEEAAEDLVSTPMTSAFLRAWVYRPGEDSEEEDEENEDEDGDSVAADSEPNPSLQAQSAFLRGWLGGRGQDMGGGAAEEPGQSEPDAFPVAFYLPGEKPPPPWAPPQLPLRLQRRLRSAETPPQQLDPKTALKARKVRFSEEVSVHLLAVWAGPARAARRGPWEQMARDRSRFTRRIARAEEELGPCLMPAVRARAWARLQNPPDCPATIPVPSQTLPTPMSQAMASTFPSTAVSLCLDLSGRRG